MGKKSRKRNHNTRKIDSPSKSQSSRLCFSEHWHCSIIARSGISGEVLIYLHALATMAYGIKVESRLSSTRGNSIFQLEDNLRLYLDNEIENSFRYSFVFLSSYLVVPFWTG